MPLNRTAAMINSTYRSQAKSHPRWAPQRLVLGALLAMCTCICLAQDMVWDGNWWRELERPQKQSAVLGFFMGLNHGCQLSAVAFTDGLPVAGSSLATHCSANIKAYGRTTAGQFIDGLDTLYADFRNRSIPFGSAMWYVANQTSGIRQSGLDELLDIMRSQAK